MPFNIYVKRIQSAYSKGFQSKTAIVQALFYIYYIYLSLKSYFTTSPQGGVGSIIMGPGVNYAFINITVKDNSLPEAEKMFQVELINPSGGAALGPASKVNVTIQASDGAFGIFQFDDTSLSVRGTEDGDEGFNIVSLQVDETNTYPWACFYQSSKT